MFKKSNPQLTRNKFSLTATEILEDLEAISNNEEHRNKLFVCLDDKPPQPQELERRFEDMGESLKGTQKLEEISKMLQLQVVKLQMLANDLTSSIDEVEEKIEACQ